MAGTFLNIEHGVQNTLSRLFEDLANQLVLEVVDNIEEKEEVGHKIYHSIHLEAMLYVSWKFDRFNVYDIVIFSTNLYYDETYFSFR